MPETLADKIIKRADAPIQIQYLQETYEAEKKRRIEFREWITPDVKAEFINGETIIHSPAKKRHWSASVLNSLDFVISVEKTAQDTPELTWNQEQLDKCIIP